MRNERRRARRVWRLPFSSWYPFEFRSGGRGFWCAWALQLFSCSFDALDTASSNSFYLSLMFCACVCMRALGHDLREARAGDAARMRELVWRHQTALRFADEISSIIGPIMFVQSIGTSLMLCAAVLNLTLTELNSIKFLAAVVFVVFEMSELYLYCLFGTEIQTVSEACGDAAYASRWYEAPPRAQRSLHILLLRAQKPASVRGFGYMTVSLPLFVGMLRLSYSYYALLTQVDD